MANADVNSTPFRTHPLDHSGNIVLYKTFSETIISAAFVVDICTRVRYGHKAYNISGGIAGGEWNHNWEPNSCAVRIPTFVDVLVKRNKL